MTKQEMKTKIEQLEKENGRLQKGIEYINGEHKTEVKKLKEQIEDLYKFPRGTYGNKLQRVVACAKELDFGFLLFNLRDRCSDFPSCITRIENLQQAIEDSK